MNENPDAFFPDSSATVSVGGQVLHYLKIGNGNKLVLAFHGYGNDASMFRFLNHDEFTLLSFDLPFQRKSSGEKGAILLKQDLKIMVTNLMKVYEVEKIGLLGFSLGARICLCIAAEMGSQIRNIVLVAPDGIQHNYFYRMLTGTGFGRFLFKGFVAYGKGYLKLFSLLNKSGLLNNYKYKFALQYIRTPESRKRLLDIWMNTSKLIPDLKKVKNLVDTKKIPVHILMGQQDKVIPLKNAHQFKGRNANIQLHVFERGHNLLEFEEVKGTVATWLFRTNKSSQSL